MVAISRQYCCLWRSWARALWAPPMHLYVFKLGVSFQTQKIYLDKDIGNAKSLVTKHLITDPRDGVVFRYFYGNKNYVKIDKMKKSLNTS